MLGPDHPDTLWTRHELAWLAASEGRWAEAEEGYREVLAVRRRTLGDEYFEILWAQHELAWTVANQGRGQEAEQKRVRVRAGRDIIEGTFDGRDDVLGANEVVVAELELGVNRPEIGCRPHEDLVGAEGQERHRALGVVGHDDRERLAPCLGRPDEPHRDFAVAAG